MATASYLEKAECRAAIKQITQLAEFLLKFYPGEIGKGENVVEITIRILSPTEAVNDTNAKVPNWAVDTLAKKELRRLAQTVMEDYPNHIGEGGVVDTVLRMLKTAYVDKIIPLASN